MLTADRSTVHAGYHDGVVTLTGGTSQSMWIATADLLRGLPDRLNQRSMDLLAIAASVYTLDRAHKRPETEETNDAGMRTLRLSIAVYDAPFWSSDDTINPLTELLCTLTGDTWLLSFVPRYDAYSAVTPQHPLQLGGSFSNRVALYSGGLDSAAGLARWLLDGHAPPLLLTAGHHSAIRPRVHTQLTRLGAMLPSAPLSHAWFDVCLRRGVARRLRDQEQTQRARAFLFCAAAALVAEACHLDQVLLFENGVGAINMPLTEGGLIGAFSTRGAHPGMLAKVSALFSRVLGRDLQFTLPYVLHTKAEMLASLAFDPQLSQWAQRSHSCVHSSWRVLGKPHCGVCPACLERRQAFRASGIEEDSSNYDADIFAGHAPPDPAYFHTYVANAYAWAHDRARMTDRMARHLTLSGTTGIPLAAANALYRRHALEVEHVYGGLELGMPLHKARLPAPQLELL